MKSAYGTYLEEQNEVLNQFLNLFLTTRVIGKSRLCHFQSSLVISIHSLQGLYKELQFEGYGYLVSARCNQDVPESYSSQTRGLGEIYDHPLPTAVR